MTVQVKQALADARKQLAAHVDVAQLEAQLLLGFVLQQSSTWLIAHDDEDLTDTQFTRFQKLIKQRLKGQPVAHLVGERAFWTLNLAVTTDTLIPRPETELLVETALTLFKAEQPIQLLDLGTGSGAIALAIASERPAWSITATDQSLAALNIARQNAEQHGLKNIHFETGNWFDALTSGARFDAILSNPPYIACDDQHLDEGDVRFEPREALASGQDGLNDIRVIVLQSINHLNTNGWLLFEHGYDQGAAARKLMQENGFINIKTLRDLNGLDRLTFGQVPR
jgi:release factor glutamine methyltransferase